MAEMGSTMYDIIKDYLNYLSTHPNGGEISYRTEFEKFFKKSIPSHLKYKNITVIQEDRYSGIEIKGTPDFFVYEDYDSLLKKLVGFIECKEPAYKLEKLIESEQIKKYAQTCENIIITNYHRFILLQKGKKEHDFELSNEQNSIQKFENMLRDFYSYDYPYIKTKKSLVTALAAQSFYYSVALREFMANKGNEMENFYIKFNLLFSEFQKSISYHYELEDFCDIYSQSLVYGLMLSCIDTTKKLDEKELDYLRGIPNEYKLLYEFLSKAYENRDFPMPIKMALINIGKNINLISIEDIKKEFAKTNNGKQNIAVYLYEDFMKEYDKLRQTEKRKENGVYYTPNEAADFIARSVNEIIKTKFSLPKGYLSDNVKTLDFACGTGTFLHSIFQLILQNIGDDLDKGELLGKISEDIYGFELLFTPHIIAHTFLMKLLKENGLEMNGERLRIYLTNTLDIDAQHSISEHMPELKKEYDKSTDIKNKEQILAIVGNPPYRNGKSQAKEGRIDSELNKYKEGLNDKKINLDDLYIKFIRFAELKIEKSGYGIIGIITNNSYLYGKTHRQMRKHLYNTFDEIYIVNLHGNAHKSEKDKNIFDIMVGVSIAFFVKLKEPAKKCVRYFSTMDNNIVSRQEKLSFLENTKFEKIKWKKLNPKETEYFWFVDKNLSLQSEYNKFWKVTDIFKDMNSGLNTLQDPVCSVYSRKQIKEVVNNFKDLSIEALQEKYNLKEARDWTISGAKNDCKNNYKENLFIQYNFRPFDIRHTFYSGQTRGFIGTPSRSTKDYYVNNNLTLITKKQMKSNSFANIFITNEIVDRSFLESAYGGA
jgi:hypothetical protein